jgi:hypothetical protein
VAATGRPLLRYEQVLPTLEDVFVRLVSAAPGGTGVPAGPSDAHQLKDEDQLIGAASAVRQAQIGENK